MKEDSDNPFLLSDYKGPALFCDRAEETALLISNARNGVNSTLLSIRRMGKTGLIRHAFQKMEAGRKIRGIYFDIYATQSFRDFTNQFATAVLHAFPEKQSIGKKLMTLIRSFRPVLSFDALTGEPEVTFDFAQQKQYEHSFNGLLNFLEKQQVKIVIAIDEFQQVSNYPEKNVEALLRTSIQPLKNVQFIFSGSNRHLLTEMFMDSKRPFFSSTRNLHLKPINAHIYQQFIQGVFHSHKRKITTDGLEFITDWTRLHTYYTQAVCNKIFASGVRSITLDTVQQCCGQLLNEQEAIFFQYRNLLTPIQWSLIKAIAVEDKVYKPSSKSFIRKHDVGTSANVQRALHSLLQKEMIYRDTDDIGSYYSVYDCFLARWIAR